MLRSDIGIIYNDYYDDLKVKDLIKRSDMLSNLVLDYLSDNNEYIYIDNYDDFYYYTFHILLQKIFSRFPNIKVVISISDGEGYNLYEIDKDTKFLFTKEGVVPDSNTIFDGEFIDYIFFFCKFYDKYGYYEPINNYDLSHISAVRTVGICLFEPIYEILDNNINYKLDSYIYPDGCIDIN